MNPRKRSGGRRRRVIAAAAIGLAVTATGAACSSSSSGSPSSTAAGTPAASATSSAASIAAALQQKSSITVWAWAPQVKDIVTAFEKKYPNVTVNLVNAGTCSTEYTKLQNAVKAGSGGPDVAQIEYYALPQFALPGSLANLADYGLDSLKGDYAQAVWDSVTVGGQLVGLPQDTGPMALFYNQKVFTQYGLTVPKTWADYLADAKKLHAANPKDYITNDTGDPGFVTSMIWDAGGHPYTLSGTKNVSLNLQDAGSKKFTSLWNQMIAGSLISPISSWSTQWYTGLGNGSIASLVIGAWMPGNLETGVTAASGDWRVAPMPTWTAGGPPATSENGGSSDVVMKQSKNPLVAAGFLQFMNQGAGTTIFANEGGFPSETSVLNSPSFLDQAPKYFGGQKINQVLSQSAASVIPGWSYLPFQVYANSVFPDTVGKAYADKANLNGALQAWQAASAQYGTQEGFTVASS
jgi:multiple sugar transport system substrate-binding protein